MTIMMMTMMMKILLEHSAPFERTPFKTEELPVYGWDV